jgi:hypothetical protein
MTFCCFIISKEEKRKKKSERKKGDLYERKNLSIRKKNGYVLNHRRKENILFRPTCKYNVDREK